MALDDCVCVAEIDELAVDDVVCDLLRDCVEVRDCVILVDCDRERVCA